MTERRSRMRRTRNGKHLALTPRDLEIFRTLCRYRFLRSTYLHAFVGGASEKRFVERLGDLFHEGYLDRPDKQWRFADARCRPVVYELGKGGREVITAAPETEAVTWLRDGPHKQFEHSLMICEVLASIELAIRDQPDLRFIAWPEMLARAPETTRRSARPYQLTTGEVSVVPDALFGIEYRRDVRKAYRFFALEADRGTMPITRSGADETSILGKFAAYRAVITHQTHKAHLSVPNLLVLTVTTGERRVHEIIRLLEEQNCSSPAFLFKETPNDGAHSLGHAPIRGLLSALWLRPGSPLLCLLS